MVEPTYDDYNSRIDIKDLLVEAGYHFNRREGLRYPAFVRLDGNGVRVKGDKFIVSPHGNLCFHPPMIHVYNVVSFIKEFPDLFAEYTPGMNLDRLVNLVCQRMLGLPTRTEWADIKHGAENRHFEMERYEVVPYEVGNRENNLKFYTYFRQRGLDLLTQKAFAEHFFLATDTTRNTENKFYNLSFPYREPGKEEIVGLEERGMRRKDGSAYKGKASGTNSVSAMWIANLSGYPLEKVKRVFWFESAYDAMAFHQINRKQYKDTRGVYISTGGSPSMSQFASMLAATPQAQHHLCFDRDLAGQMYCCNFMMQRAGREVSSYNSPGGAIIFLDRTSGESIRFEPGDFSYANFCEKLGLKDVKTIYHPADADYKDWNDQLLGKTIQEVAAEKLEIRKKEAEQQCPVQSQDAERSEPSEEQQTNPQIGGEKGNKEVKLQAENQDTGKENWKVAEQSEGRAIYGKVIPSRINRMTESDGREEESSQTQSGYVRYPSRINSRDMEQEAQESDDRSEPQRPEKRSDVEETDRPSRGFHR